MNRTLREGTSAILAHAQLNHRWWHFAIQYLIHVHNATTFYKPPGSDQEISIAEYVYKSLNRIPRLQPFGQRGYMAIPPDIRRKASFTDLQGLPIRYLGPRPNIGDLFLHEETGKIYESRDVVYDREIRSTPAYTPPIPTPVTDDNAEAVVPEEVIDEIPAIDPAELKNAHSSLLGQAFLLSTSSSGPSSPDPLTYEAAIKSPEALQWKAAIDAEYKKFEETNTMEEVVVPPNWKQVKSKFVFKTKLDANGQITKRKAPLVAKGFLQMPGLDYDIDGISLPVARLVLLRLLLTLAASDDLHVHQMVAESAFLNGYLTEEIYMEFPPGYKPKDPHATGLRLIKSVYGLKQAGRVWYDALREYLLSIGFICIEKDWGIFTRPKKDGSITYIYVYVDDVLIISKRLETVQSVKNQLTNCWKWTDLGPARYILGIKIEWQRKSKMVQLSQRHYAETIVSRFNLSNAKPEKLPVSPGEKYTRSEADPNALCAKEYQSMVGSLVWLALATRPDLTYAVNFFSRFNSNPSDHHIHGVRKVLKYVSGTSSYALCLGEPNFPTGLHGYSDADLAGDLEKRKSISAYVFKYANSTINWGSRLQDLVVDSTTEAKYVALADAVREARFLRQFLLELRLHSPVEPPTTIHCNSQSALKLAHDPVQHQRMKHIEIKYHISRQAIKKGEV